MTIKEIHFSKLYLAYLQYRDAGISSHKLAAELGVSHTWLATRWRAMGYVMKKSGRPKSKRRPVLPGVSVEPEILAALQKQSVDRKKPLPDIRRQAYSEFVGKKK